jgi:heat shock protein HtpX
MFGKRIILFIAVNFLIMATISIVTSALGIQPYLTAYGINYESLMIFCLLWGMGGAFISLALSKKMAKWMMGVKIIDKNTTDKSLRELITKVHSLARKAKLPKMPDVGTYESPEINAFATGPSRSRSLVAVSTGLLQNMSEDELEGVLAHEVAHIANGDMVTMTLIQGVVNAFVMFLARAIAFAILQATRGEDEEGEGVGGLAYFGLVILFDILFSILGSLVVKWFSRWREYRADAAGARITQRHRMIAALEALQRTIETPQAQQNQAAMQSLQISGRPSGFMKWFSTHPPLEERIRRLKRAV